MGQGGESSQGKSSVGATDDAGPGSRDGTGE